MRRLRSTCSSNNPRPLNPDWQTQTAFSFVGATSRSRLFQSGQDAPPTHYKAGGMVANSRVFCTSMDISGFTDAKINSLSTSGSASSAWRKILLRSSDRNTRRLPHVHRHGCGHPNGQPFLDRCNSLQADAPIPTGEP